ncbi:GAF domain-containing protein [Streptomyces sp. AV19]|uniref:helix-turn-helix domain-containing protein n=1 Tax=Streptomyces sp. AV19 TaxID=2793068 RepID=UPI0018FF06D7|nr:GAF domain-containing protein [Streptomyces sp. AV19]MBH1937941.1 GAF domain-containing protein [Streptomyces sp. AV19]MDG4536880.1 GAF domain-containing protein [Streptomyces sp. AV19]
MMTEPWLELLLADASADAISRHRDALIHDGVDALHVERQAGAALRLKSLLDRQRNWASGLLLLNDMATQLAGVRSPDRLLREITEQARRILGADLAYIGLVRRDEVVVEVASGARTPQLRGLRVPCTTGMLGAVVHRGEPVRTSDYFMESAFVHQPYDALADAEQFRSMLGVPLAGPGRAAGALIVCRRHERRFADDEVVLLSALASHASVSMDTATTLERYRSATEQLLLVKTQLERALEWDQRLNAVVLRGGGVAELVSEIAGATTGDATFVDAAGGLPVELAERLPWLPPLLETWSDDPSDECHVFRAGEGTVQVRTVAAGQTVLGALVLVGDHGDDHELFLERAVPVLARTVLAERAVVQATRADRDALLLNLLNRPEPDPVILRRRMRSVGLDPSAPYCLIAAQPGQGLQKARQGLNGLTLPTGTVVAVDGARLLAVVPTGDPEALVRAWRARGGSPTTTLGVSGPSKGPADLHRCYRDAVHTLDALLTLSRTGAAATADQLGIYRVLLRHTGRKELQTQFEELLGPVVREQKRRSVPLLATVKAFLDHGCRAAPAARALGIHTNTLYQRLAVLDQCLGSGWREPPRLLDLHILLRVHPEPEPW